MIDVVELHNNKYHPKKIKIIIDVTYGIPYEFNEYFCDLGKWPADQIKQPRLPRPWQRDRTHIFSVWNYRTRNEERYKRPQIMNSTVLYEIRSETLKAVYHCVV